MTKQALKLYKITEKLDNKFYKIFSESFYEEHGMEDLLQEAHDMLLTSFIQEQGDERSWVEFYDSFNSPGMDDGSLPVAWKDGFLPDKIANFVVNENFKQAKKLYKKCIKIENT